MAGTELLLALDYGGTKHSAALLARGEGTWLAQARTYSPPGADARYDQATMLRMAHELLARHPGRLLAIGVSFGGPVDAGRGLVRLSHHVPGWEETPLRAWLEAEFGVPAAVDNDANVAALGEWRYGAGQGCRSLLYVTVSTGIGGGWVLDGRIYSGADGMAGEIGHMVVRPGGAACVCGKRGCLEAEACGPAIARLARERLAQQPDAARALLALTYGKPEAITGELVARAAQAGDRLAGEVLAHAAGMLGFGIGAAINLMNPELVVLGGGVTKSGPRYWELVREAARAHALPQMRVEIMPAALGDDAPLWGAVALAENLL
ncbi:MAG: ROK family protein [Anaerolineae bacterium]